MKKYLLFLALFPLMISCVYATPLRIGTTGDYPPLTSFNIKTQQFSGFDIAMAKNLGKYLHRPVQWVKTTWPSMSNDLLAGKFSIAMGGIDSNSERKKLFLMSLPVLTDGKSPLVRCVDVNRFNSIKKINQPNITVIENIGGTNAKFAQKFLSRATLVIIKNNQQTFTYLLNHKADVMITDSIEAVYQQKLKPGLCAVNPQHPFTRSHKVYLIAKSDPELLKKVNQWIISLKQSGKLQQLIKQYSIPYSSQ